MRVSFKYSQEDLVDATVRFSARSKALRDIRRRQLFWSAVILGLLALLIFKISIVGMIVAAVAVLVVVIINPYLYDHRYRNNLRKFYKEKLGIEDEFICEVELLPEGMKTSGQNFHCTMEWSTIEDEPFPDFCCTAHFPCRVIRLPDLARRDVTTGASAADETTATAGAAGE